MDSVTYTEALSRLGKNAVLISQNDFDAWHETAYLLRSPANALFSVQFHGSHPPVSYRPRSAVFPPPTLNRCSRRSPRQRTSTRPDRGCKPLPKRAATPPPTESRYRQPSNWP